MEGKLSVLLHLVGCRSPASRCSVTPSFSTFVISRPCTRGPRPQEVQSAQPGPPSAPSHRGGLRLPHAGRHLRTGSHPTSNGLQDPALLGAASPRSHAARRRQSSRSPATPGEEQKGPGPRPPPEIGRAHV